TQTLDQALKQGRISHAYLLTGPQGVGKTSVARILAHEINSLPYTDNSPHLDIIEIDAASNRRIDEIRDLRDKVYVAPTSAKYKVYIIDEVHMLTREAFNALLKTLEEPPEHVVFILATTDAHKLPETIVSRTQRFTFKPVEKGEVIDHLRAIAKEEKISVSDEALDLLAEHGEGSFRDSISLLDQASSQGSKLDASAVQALLGIPPDEGIQQLLQQIAQPSAGLASVAEALHQLYAQGYQPAVIAKRLGQLLREQLLSNQTALSSRETTTLLAQLLEVPASVDPQAFLEIILLAAASNMTGAFNSDAPVQQPKALKDAPAEPEKQIAKPADKSKAVEQPKPKPAKRSSVNNGIWPEVLQALKQSHNTLYGIVRMAEPTFGEDGTLTLAFAFAFHQKRLNDTKHRQLLAGVIEEISGQTVQIECIVDKTVSSTPAAEVPLEQARPEGNGALSTISNIFGGGELLE
ncbi:MAG TPA: DNA polymerase III subunit gamma/tau, partial [Verrucomicrobiae bacterium]|nr:DNA polymerase III subunit gamma/tau [Verrucomicrobiae bacterium]